MNGTASLRARFDRHLTEAWRRFHETQTAVSGPGISKTDRPSFWAEFRRTLPDEFKSLFEELVQGGEELLQTAEAGTFAALRAALDGRPEFSLGSGPEQPDGAPAVPSREDRPAQDGAGKFADWLSAQAGTVKVIATGYPPDLSIEPAGAGRRFPVDQPITFAPMSTPQLGQILNLMAKRQGVALSDGAKMAFREHFERRRTAPDFANAGEVSVLLDAAVARQRQRLGDGAAAKSVEAQDVIGAIVDSDMGPKQS